MKDVAVLHAAVEKMREMVEAHERIHAAVTQPKKDMPATKTVLIKEIKEEE